MLHLLLSMVDKDIEERYAGVQHSAYLPTVATASCWLVGAFSSDYMAFPPSNSAFSPFSELSVPYLLYSFQFLKI